MLRKHDWYKGPPCFITLKMFMSDPTLIMWMPLGSVVIRPHSEITTFISGRVAGGVFKTGDEVSVLPSDLLQKLNRFYWLTK